MKRRTTIQLLFGHGVNVPNGQKMAFSSGILISIFEIGIIGTVQEVMILFTLIPSFMIILFFIVTALVIDPIKLPLFWFLLNILSHSLKCETINYKFKVL